LNDKATFNYERYLKIDMAFHIAILEASRNELLAQIGRTMRHAFQTARQADIRDIGILSASQLFHAAVVRAITRKDPEDAYSASREINS
jgi:DNA-binding FadR family transcriptional regulator